MNDDFQGFLDAAKNGSTNESPLPEESSELAIELEPTLLEALERYAEDRELGRDEAIAHLLRGSLKRRRYLE